jgi:putative ABC transport system permease protein
VFRRILFASLAARRLRLALGMMAVALGVAVAIALGTLALEAGDDFARTLRAAGPNFVVQPAGAQWRMDPGGEEVPAARAGATLPTALVTKLKQSFWRNNVLHAAPELATAARVGGQPTIAIGTWFDRELTVEGVRWRTGLAHLRSRWTVQGRWPRDGAAEIALGRDLARRLGGVVGQPTTVTIEGREARMMITGVVEAGGLEDSHAWLPLERLQSLAELGDEADRVWLSALVKPAPRGPAPHPERDPEGYERYLCTAYPANIARDLADRLAGAEVLPLSEIVAGEAQVVRRLDLLMLMLAIATLGASILGLISTTTATVVERRVELALLRSLGASPTQLGVLLLGETLLVSLAGGWLGWIAGGFGAIAIRGEAFGGPGAIQPLLLPPALGLAAVLALIGTLGPLRVALRLDPATVLRG